MRVWEWFTSKRCLLGHSAWVGVGENEHKTRVCTECKALRCKAMELSTLDDTALLQALFPSDNKMRDYVLDLVARFKLFDMTVRDVILWLGGVQERDVYSALIQSIIMCHMIRRLPRDVRWCAEWFMEARVLVVAAFDEVADASAIAAANNEQARAELMQRVYIEANKRIVKADGKLKAYKEVSPSTFAQMLWGHSRLDAFKELQPGNTIAIN